MARLTALPRSASNEDTVRELRRALAGKSNVLAAKAADIAAECAATALVSDLAAAFDRLLPEPDKADKGCLAKIAIVRALNSLEYDDTELFLQGIRHFQLEPAFGGRVDVADHLRAESAFGLVRLGYLEVLFELTTLLSDPEIAARRAAIEALRMVAAEACELLLRLKASSGDAEPELMGEVLSALVSINFERSKELVARFLSSRDQIIAQGAALALGETRRPEAFDLLRRQWRSWIDGERRKVLLLPIALLRSDESVRFLVQVVRNDPRELAIAALAALRIYADDPDRRETVRAAALQRDDSDVAEAYVREFGRDART
ncbi:hypothetical protein ACFL59_08125 [Planctomycetota bacterium]